MRRLLPALAALSLALPVRAHAQADAWWAHVQRLADDSMRGRETGSREHRQAAEYVAAAFRRAGLRPAGTDGYFQPVPFLVRRIDERRSSLALARGGTSRPLPLGEAATIGARGARETTIDAPLVFAGYGLVIPELGIDDLRGLDLAGKAVVVLAGGVPRGVPGPAIANARSGLGARLRAAGAAALVTVANPRGDVPWARASAARLNPQMELDEGRSPEAPLVGVTVNPAHAERLFEGSGRRYADLQALADSGAALPGGPLAASLQATVGLVEARVTSDNVAGVLVGADPALRAEHVVVTAHIDHVGVGAPVEGDSIFNGAMDNASGVATMLETVATLAARTPRPRRSVLFLAVTAEEKGLLGSAWYARHPTVPAASVVADLNTDMFLPINPLRRLLVNGLEESDLAEDVRRAAAPRGVEVITDPEPERNAFIRSDQYSFIREGIPALSFKVGFVRGSPEHDRVLRWRQERYHGVRDDLAQPIDRQAAADFNALYADIIGQVASRPTRPAWFPTSLFRPKPATP